MVTVDVIDVNDNAPMISGDFSDVRSGDVMKAGQKITSVSASDADCTDEICGFEIANEEETPFNITTTGSCCLCYSVRV